MTNTYGIPITDAVLNVLDVVSRFEGKSAPQSKLLRAMNVASNDGRAHRQRLMRTMETAGLLHSAPGPNRSVLWCVSQLGATVMLGPDL